MVGDNNENGEEVNVDDAGLDVMLMLMMLIQLLENNI